LDPAAGGYGGAIVEVAGDRGQGREGIAARLVVVDVGGPARSIRQRPCGRRCRAGAVTRGGPAVGRRFVRSISVGVVSTTASPGRFDTRPVRVLNKKPS